MTTTIELGNGNNGQSDIPDGGKVNFHNNTNKSITLTTPQGINPAGQTTIAVDATTSDFTVSANVGSTLTYSWDNTDSAALATRSGTIKVTS